LQRVASNETGVAGRHAELEGGGTVEFGIGGQEAFGGAEEGGGGDEKEGENAGQGEGSKASGLTSAPKVFDGFERHVVEVVGKVLDGVVHKGNRSVCALALGQLEEVYEPVGDARIVLADPTGHFLVGGAGKKTDQSAEGACQHDRYDADRNRSDSGCKGGPSRRAQPEARFEQGR
jgi:hypothetical protein